MIYLGVFLISDGLFLISDRLTELKWLAFVRC